MSLRKVRMVAGFALVMCLACVVAVAQNITGTITGTVTDPSGAVVPNASIVINNMSTKSLIRTVKTDEHGVYSAPYLAVGEYRLSVQAPGFENANIPNVTLNVGDTVTQNVSLKTGSAAETVTVTANEVAPNTETPENSSVINELQMKELALNTRNFEQMLLLQPGVSYTGADELAPGLINAAGGANAHQLSVNGLQPTQLSFNFDGADTLNHITIAQSVLFPSVDSIQQVKILRDSYGAQYGGGGSAQVLIVSKAGGDAFHGDAYFFLRNQYLNANNYFNLIATPQLPRPPSHYDDFGVALGGPLYIPKIWPKGHSNTYFFYSEELRRLGTNVSSQKVAYPTVANLNGYFAGPVCVPFADGGVATTYAACSSLGDGQSPLVTNSPFAGFNYQFPIINPAAQAYIKDVMVPAEAIQQPNVIGNANAVNLSLPSSTRSNQILARIDHKFSDRLSGFFRYIFDPYTINAPSGYLLNTSYPGVNTSTIQTYGEDFLAHGTFTATPTLVLDFGYSYLPYEIKTTPTGTAVAANSPDVQIALPFPSTTGMIPQIEINGQTWGPNGPLREMDHTQQVFENTTKQMGRHTLSFGANYERFYEISNQGALNKGKFVFNGTGKPTVTSAFEGIFATFLAGQPTSLTQSSVDPVARIAQNVEEAYIQDNWRARAHLTLQAGLRYTLYGQPYDEAGNLGAFAPEAYHRSQAPAISPQDGLECLPGGTDSRCIGITPNAAYKSLNGIVQGGVNSPYGKAINRRNWLDFAPRVGFSLDVYGNGKTALRGGYGIFYDQVAQTIPQGEVYSNPAYVQTITFASPSFSNPGGSGTQPIPLVIGGSQPNWTTPYTQSYSLDVQQQFGPSFMVTLAYVGNKTFHLQGVEDINEPLPGEYAANAPAQSVTSNSGGTALAATVLQPVNQQETQDLNFVRPYPGYAAINFFDTRFFADYNGLQVGLIKSFAKARGAHISVNYTWSKALANSRNFTTAPQNTYDLSSEWGPTTSDRRQLFNASVVYHLPFFRRQRGFKGKLLGGYEFSLIAQLTSGLWLTPATSQHDSAGQGGFASSGSDTVLRLDQSGDANMHAPHTQPEYFNTAMFSLVPSNVYRPANGRVGTVEGPGFQTYNLSLMRNIDFPENFRLQLRFEAFNALNHVNFNAVDTSFNTIGFGSVTSANDNRQIQVGAKLYF